MYLLWFYMCLSILKENLATNEETSNDDLLVESLQYCKELGHNYWLCEYHNLTGSILRANCHLKDGEWGSEVTLSYEIEDLLVESLQYCKELGHNYWLCEYHNLTGSILRANCHLKDGEWGSEVTLSYEIEEPHKTPYQITPICVFNTTYIGEYICSLRIDVSKLTYKTEIKCKAVYYINGFNQIQDKLIFKQKETYLEKHPSFDPVVWTRKPLIDCQNRMGYKELAWDLDVKKGRRNGMTQNITRYTPGELKADCVLACLTSFKAGDDWNLTWTLDDHIIMKGSVKNPNVFKLPLSINLLEQHNGKVLKCSLTSERAYRGIFTVMMLETILILPGDHQFALAANNLPQELPNSTPAPYNTDNKDSKIIIISAAAVGAIVCLSLLVAFIFACRRRCFNASAPTGNNNDNDEDGGYTELTIHKVVYANLALPQNNREFTTTPMTEYAEIVGIITDSNDRRLL